MEQILRKYDEYIAKGDINQALRLLLYWKDDFTKNNNLSSLFTILNELEGFYRKQHKKDECLNIVNDIIDVMNKMGIEESKSSVVPYINIATAYSAFSLFEDSYKYFLKAKNILDANNDDKIDTKYQYASLYNNMSTTLSYLKQYDEAIECCENAIKINESISDGRYNSAITYLNMASIIESRDGKSNNNENIKECLKKAKEVLDDMSIKRDINYLFAIIKCIDSFRYFGDNLYVDELIKRQKEIKEKLQ